MPEFIIKDYPFREVEINKIESDKEQDWPVVYHIRKNNNVYIGETVNFKNRMLQHLKRQKVIHSLVLQSVL